MCVHVCEGVSAHMYVCLVARGRLCLSFLRCCFSLWGFSLGWSSPSVLGWLVSEPQGSLCLHLPSAGIVSAATTSNSTSISLTDRPMQPELSLFLVPLVLMPQLPHCRWASWKMPLTGPGLALYHKHSCSFLGSHYRTELGADHSPRGAAGRRGEGEAQQRARTLPGPGDGG